MAVVNPEPRVPAEPAATAWDAGGLHFDVSFRGPGATLRVFGDVAGHRKELLRFDDFVDGPHYHVPAEGDPILFDRATLGEPLDWIVAQVRDHLADLLTAAGFADVLAGADIGAAAGSAEKVRKAMVDCVPDGYVRVEGVGLQRVEA
jgi:hypothetical protein